MADQDQTAEELAAAEAERLAAEAARVEGDDLPKPRSASGGDSSGSEPAAEKPKRRGRPRKAAEQKPSLPAIASERAVETAAELYGLAGILPSVAGFPNAGAVMQAQSEQGGKALANYALGHFPRLYAFLESTGGAAGELLPLILAPIACEVYLRTQNPQVEQLTSALLGGFLGSAKVTVPTDEGSMVEVELLPMIHSARAQAVSARTGRMSADVADELAQAQARAQAMADAQQNGSDPDVPHEPSPAARAVSGEGWFGGDEAA